MNNKRLALLTGNFTAKNRLVNIVAVQAMLLTIPSLHSGFHKRVVHYDANITAILVEPDGTGRLVMSAVRRQDRGFIPDLLAANFAPVDLALGGKGFTANDVVDLVRKYAVDAFADKVQSILDNFELEVKRATDDAMARATGELGVLSKLI